MVGRLIDLRNGGERGDRSERKGNDDEKNDVIFQGVREPNLKKSTDEIIR